MKYVSKLLFISCVEQSNARQVDIWYDLLNVVQFKLVLFSKYKFREFESIWRAILTV